MSDSRFSGTPGTGAPSSADPYGFFAQPTQQPDGGFAQQGAPSSGTATPFGAPSGAPFGAPVAPFGSPPPYAAPYSTTRPGPSGRHGARVAGLVVVALVVLAGAWYGWRVWEHHQPVHVPTMLGGLPAASDP